MIDIPDYTDEEKKVIFQRFALRKVFERMGMKEEECVLTEDGLDAVIKLHENTSGIRDLEQAAEHLAANALYQIEVDKVKQVVFDAEAVLSFWASIAYTGIVTKIKGDCQDERIWKIQKIR